MILHGVLVVPTGVRPGESNETRNSSEGLPSTLCMPNEHAPRLLFAAPVQAGECLQTRAALPWELAWP